MQNFTEALRSLDTENPDGVEVVLYGEADSRRLLRGIRSTAAATDATGWTRARTDGAVEIVAHRKAGLRDFLHQIPLNIPELNDLNVTIHKSSHAANYTRFRIRREQFILTDSDETNYYNSLGVNIDSRQFPVLHSSGLLADADPTFSQACQEYWQKHWGSEIDTAFHIACARITRSQDVRIVPHEAYRTIWRKLNPSEELVSAYSNKALFSWLIPTDRQPITPLVCIDGKFYDEQQNWLNSESEVQDRLESLGRGVIKPVTADNGRGVEKLEHLGNGKLMVGGDELNLRSLVRRYRRNFLVQRIVSQHHVLAAPHERSVNTLRVVTLRWRGQIHHLLTFARFGVGGRINDNAGTGGLCVGVGPDGTLNDYAIDEHATVYLSHPDSEIKFDTMPQIPNYTSLVNFALSLHAEVPYFSLLSWDIAVDGDEQPLLIECNFRGASWIYQLATGLPLFGEYTEDIITTLGRLQ